MVKALAVDRKNDVQLAITGLDHRGVIESVGLILVQYGRCFPVTTVFAEGEVHAIGLPSAVAVDHGNVAFRRMASNDALGLGRGRAAWLSALASIVLLTRPCNPAWCDTYGRLRRREPIHLRYSVRS